MSQVTIEKTAKYLIVKIPLKTVEGRRGALPHRNKTIEKAIAEGLADIEAGRVLGPFQSVREFKAALK